MKIPRRRFKKALFRYLRWRRNLENKRKWVMVVHQILDEDDANILEGVRRGICPPLKEGLLCKAPQWAYLVL
jgi:hypothetical protein